MSRHLIYAVVHNTSGGRSLTYLKKFADRATFDGWTNMMNPLNGGHCTVIKWWWDRPPCEELSAVEQQYRDTWTTEKPHARRSA